jgi:SSS family solute:Na+ symporter
VTIYAGALAITVILGHAGDAQFFWLSAFALVVVTGIYTVVGGMKAVLWTEGVQAPLLLIGSLVILFVGLDRIGGLEALKEANGEKIHMWRPLLEGAAGETWLPRDMSFLFDTNATPWLGILLASPLVGLWYWCTDQYIAQRVLTAKNLKEARRGAIFAGYLKLFPVFIFLIPGMIAVTLATQGAPGFADMKNADEAFPRMVSHLLPEGFRGLVLAGMLAALMSSLASLFNSTATLFTVDFYKRIRPTSSEKHLVTVGRVATVGMVLLGIIWIPIMQSLGENQQLYGYLQNVQSLLAPSIAAVFMLGIFSRRVTPMAGFVGIIAGFVFGMGRLALVVGRDSGGIAWPEPFETLVSIHWLYFSFLLFVVICLLIFAVSLFTKRASDAQLAGLTYASTTPEQRAAEKASYGFWEIFHTIVILAIIAGVYIYFW